MAICNKLAENTGLVLLSLWLLVRKADRVLREQRMALDASDRELRSRNAELAELGRRKDEFYAICSHDLRSPLLSIKLGNPKYASWKSFVESAYWLADLQ